MHHLLVQEIVQRDHGGLVGWVLFAAALLFLTAIVFGVL
jgi:hypothetical protein